MIDVLQPACILCLQQTSNNQDMKMTLQYQRPVLIDCEDTKTLCGKRCYREFIEWDTGEEQDQLKEAKVQESRSKKSKDFALT